MSTVIKNGTIATADRTWKADVLVEGEHITAIGENLSGDTVIDARTRTQPTAIGTMSRSSNATASLRIRRERAGTWSSCQTPPSHSGNARPRMAKARGSPAKW